MIRSRENILLSDARHIREAGHSLTYERMHRSVTATNEYNGTYVARSWERYTDPALIADGLKVLERLANLERMG